MNIKPEMVMLIIYKIRNVHFSDLEWFSITDGRPKSSPNKLVEWICKQTPPTFMRTTNKNTQSCGIRVFNKLHIRKKLLKNSTWNYCCIGDNIKQKLNSLASHFSFFCRCATKSRNLQCASASHFFRNVDVHEVRKKTFNFKRQDVSVKG